MRSATYFCSLTTRFIFMLGAHIAAPTSMSNDLDSKTQHHLRNLFWLCYIFDKDVALRTGQPQMLSEENCDLTLPPGYLSTLHSNIIFHEQYQQLLEGPIFPIDLRLSIIKSRTHSALYSFKALQKSDAELLKEIRELDDELERWRMSVPPLWRPTMSYSHETPLDPNANMHSVVLRLNYHLCMTVIHQASSRCKAWVNGQSGMMDGVSSSLALSVEASRSTLMYLRAAEHVLVSGAFWYVFQPPPLHIPSTLTSNEKGHNLLPHVRPNLHILQHPPKPSRPAIQPRSRPPQSHQRRHGACFPAAVFVD